MIRAVLSETKCIEVEGDGEAEKESAEAVIDGLVVVGEGTRQEGHGEAGEEAEVADGEEAARIPAIEEDRRRCSRKRSSTNRLRMGILLRTG
jgi:hypothetical protein